MLQRNSVQYGVLRRTEGASICREGKAWCWRFDLTYYWCVRIDNTVKHLSLRPPPFEDNFSPRRVRRSQGSIRTDVKLQCSPIFMAIVVPLSRSARMMKKIASLTQISDSHSATLEGAGPTYITSIAADLNCNGDSRTGKFISRLVSLPNLHDEQH